MVRAGLPISVSESVSLWSDPHTREGLRPPGVEPGLGSVFTLHEVGAFVLGDDWNYRGVRSPFWRLYHNDAPGAALRIGRRRFELTPNRVWLVPDGVTFDCVGIAGPAHLWIHFSPGVTVIRDWLEPRSVAVQPPLRALLAWLRRTTTADPAQAWTAGQVGLALLHAAFAEAGPEGTRAVEPRLRAVLLAIERRLATPPSVAELAALAHLGESGFNRWFRAAVGATPADYVQRRRITEASRRLAFTDDSVEQVAEALGYANRFHFSRAFKRVTGESPGGFKRRGRSR